MSGKRGEISVFCICFTEIEFKNLSRSWRGKEEWRLQERGGGDARSNGTLIDSRIRRLIIYVCNFDAFSLACFENDVYFIDENLLFRMLNILHDKTTCLCFVYKKVGEKYLYSSKMIRKFNKTILMNLIKFPLYSSMRETWRGWRATFFQYEFQIRLKFGNEFLIFFFFFFSIKPIRERRKIFAQDKSGRLSPFSICAYIIIRCTNKSLPLFLYRNFRPTFESLVAPSER